MRNINNIALPKQPATGPALPGIQPRILLCPTSQMRLARDIQHKIVQGEITPI